MKSAHRIMHFYCQTDPGLKREENQDSAFISPHLRLAIVADGMGGAASGRKASEQAIISILLELHATGSISQGMLKDAIRFANSEIYDMACCNPDDFGMGTTVVVCLIRDGIAYYANVGDSPLYLIRGAEITQLTENHSLAPEEPNVLTRALGIEPDVEVDTGELTLENGDTLLLCTDGLTSQLTDDEIFTVIDDSKNDLQETAKNLIGAGRIRGAPDNVTVALIHNP